MGISRLQRLFGVGPMGAVISLAVLVTALWIDHAVWHVEIMSDPIPLKVVGGVLIATGLGLHLWSMSALRHWWVEDKLCTQGPFKWFRHPMYAAWISFMVPGFALFFNSWIILFFVILLHPIWHRLVIREEAMMSRKFHREYGSYAAYTGRFFPRLGNRRSM